MKSITSCALIKKFEQFFSRHGYPETIKSDNGSNFVSNEMEGYLRQNGIQHDRSAPYWPRGNGEVKRFNKTMLKHFRAIHAEGKDWREALPSILLDYRSTKHAVTKQTPTQLLFNGEIKNKLPSFPDQPTSKAHLLARENDHIKKQNMKIQYNAAMKVKPSDLDINDEVLIKQKKINKLTSKYKVKSYKIIEKKGAIIKLYSTDGDIKVRNVVDVRRFRGGSVLKRKAKLQACDEARDNFMDDDNQDGYNMNTNDTNTNANNGQNTNDTNTNNAIMVSSRPQRMR